MHATLYIHEHRNLFKHILDKLQCHPAMHAARSSQNATQVASNPRNFSITTTLPPQPPRTPLPIACLLPHRRIKSITPSMLATPLPAALDIPPTRTAAAHAQLDDKSDDCGSGGDPHEDEHLDPQRGADVELVGGGDDPLCDDEHNRCDNCCDLQFSRQVSGLDLHYGFVFKDRGLNLRLS